MLPADESAPVMVCCAVGMHLSPATLRATGQPLPSLPSSPLASVSFTPLSFFPAQSTSVWRCQQAPSKQSWRMNSCVRQWRGRRWLVSKAHSVLHQQSPAVIHASHINRAVHADYRPLPVSADCVPSRNHLPPQTLHIRFDWSRKASAAMRWLTIELHDIYCNKRLINTHCIHASHDNS